MARTEATESEIQSAICEYLTARRVFFIRLNNIPASFIDGRGARQFRSLGNILVNPNVSLLFIDFESPNRLRIQGRADLADDLVVRVDIDQIWPNCPRYIHRMRFESLSPHAPRDGHEPPDAEWKQHFTDVLPCTPSP